MAAYLKDYTMVNTLTLEAPQWVDVRVLAANTAESHTVPTGARFVVFSATVDFYANFSGNNAIVPSVDIIFGEGSFLNPAAFFIKGISSISLVSPSACIVTMAFYR